MLCHVCILHLLIQSPQGSQGSRGTYHRPGITDSINQSILTCRFRARASLDSNAAGLRLSSAAGRFTRCGHRPPLLQATSGANSDFCKARPYSVTGRMQPAAGPPRQAPGPEWTSDDWTWLRWLDSMADCVAPVIAAPQVLVSTPLSLYLLRIIHWVVHYFNRLCMCPLFTYSHTYGLRLEDVLCAPPISTLHVRMAAGPQTPSHPDTVAYYFARLQDVLTIEWLPHGMPDGSQIYRCMVPGTPPGHYLQERGAPMPPHGLPAPNRALPPGPPNTPPSPMARPPPWLPYVHPDWAVPRTNLDLAEAMAAAPQAPAPPPPQGCPPVFQDPTAAGWSSQPTDSLQARYQPMTDAQASQEQGDGPESPSAAAAGTPVQRARPSNKMPRVVLTPNPETLRAHNPLQTSHEYAWRWLQATIHSEAKASAAAPDTLQVHPSPGTPSQPLPKASQAQRPATPTPPAQASAPTHQVPTPPPPPNRPPPHDESPPFAATGPPIGSPPHQFHAASRAGPSPKRQRQRAPSHHATRSERPQPRYRATFGDFEDDDVDRSFTYVGQLAPDILRREIRYEEAMSGRFCKRYQGLTCSGVFPNGTLCTARHACAHCLQDGHPLSNCPLIDDFRSRMLASKSYPPTTWQGNSNRTARRAHPLLPQPQRHRPPPATKAQPQQLPSPARQALQAQQLQPPARQRPERQAPHPPSRPQAQQTQRTRPGTSAQTPPSADRAACLLSDDVCG